jgi:hypothetical protein
VRGKEERNLAMGETKFPSELRGQIVANAGDQDPEHGASKGLGSFAWLDAEADFEFAIEFPSMPCVDHILSLSSSTNRVHTPAGTIVGTTTHQHRGMGFRFTLMRGSENTLARRTARHQP